MSVPTLPEILTRYQTDAEHAKLFLCLTPAWHRSGSGSNIRAHQQNVEDLFFATADVKGESTGFFKAKNKISFPIVCLSTNQDWALEYCHCWRVLSSGGRDLPENFFVRLNISVFSCGFEVALNREDSVLQLSGPYPAPAEHVSHFYL